jgi:hypothetical protein
MRILLGSHGVVVLRCPRNPIVASGQGTGRFWRAGDWFLFWFRGWLLSVH